MVLAWVKRFPKLDTQAVSRACRDWLEQMNPTVELDCAKKAKVFLSFLVRHHARRVARRNLLVR